MKPFIYGLVDPAEPKHVRYVGMAFVPSRPSVHAREARTSRAHSHKLHWIRLIQSEGRDPDFIILEELPENSSRNFVGAIESIYIDSLRRIGHRLTNMTEGGDGGRQSEEVKRKISATLTGRPGIKGRPVSEEKRQKIREKLKGRSLSEETRKRMSNARKGYKCSEEERRRRSEYLVIARNHITDETHKKMSESQKNRPPMSEETRQKLSQAGKGRPHTEEHRRKISEAIAAHWTVRKQEPKENDRG